MGEDFVGDFGPGQGVAAVVPAGDESPDRGNELGDAVEGASTDRLAGDDPEEYLDQVGGYS